MGEYMAPHKIRFSLPFFIYEIVESDVKKFGINKNKLSNIIFEKLKYNYKIFDEKADKNNVNYQFNLNNDNAEIYLESYSEFFNEKIDSQSLLFRSLFYTYINYPSDKREIIIYNDVYDRVIKAIENKKQIKIKFYGQFRTIEPFFISSTKEERFNYICCYCYKNEKIVNYRLNKIEKVIDSLKEQIHRDESLIKEYIKNFDPYLSFNKFVKVKLTPKGVKLYNQFTFIPKIIEKQNVKNSDNIIYIVEASDLKAKLFFPQFMNEVEIIEPVEMRNWFKEKIAKMNEIYS